MKEHRVLQNRTVGPQSRVLRLERKDFVFLPGEYLHAGKPGQRLSREYSLYSGDHEDYLEILYREVPQGALTPWLSRLVPGDTVTVEGPFGDFPLRPPMLEDPLLFISTGTGISPFHCFARSYPDLDYTLLHGVSHKAHCYEAGDYPEDRYISCVSREDGGAYQGRVTQWLEENDLSRFRWFLICGNTDMIYEVFRILDEKGIARERISVETYY